MKKERLVTRFTLKQAAREVLRDARFRSRSRHIAPIRWAVLGLLLGVLGTMLALILVEHYLKASLQRPAGNGQPAVTARVVRDSRFPGIPWLLSGLPSGGSGDSALNAIPGQEGISNYSSDSFAELQRLWPRDYMTLEESIQPYEKTIEGKSKNKSKNRKER
jgi:hypothetical protein